MFNKTKYKEWKLKRCWYDVRRVLSYNALYNFIIGLRNSGKTYSWKVKVVDWFLERGWRFMWLRRKVTEADETIIGFFDTIAKDEYLLKKYGEIKYVTKGNQLFINDKFAGEVQALVQHQKLKSREFTDFKTIVFDEFISESGRNEYLPDEVNALHGLVLTVMRHKKNFRVIMLGNSVRFNNPYMTYFKVKPFANGIRFYKSKGVLVEMYINKYMVTKMLQSDFGKLIAGTNYFDFAVLNQFKDGHKKFIEKKPVSCDYHCSMKYDG